MHSISGSAARLTAAGRFAFAFLWLFVLSFPAEKVIDIPGLGTISRVFGLLALAAGFLAVLIDGRVRVPSLTHAVLALFVLWTALTARWSVAPELSEVKLQTYLQLIGMIWLIWEFCPSETQLTSLMQAYVLGTFYAAFDTVSRFLLARQTYYQRYAAEGFDPNDLALTLSLSIPLSYYLAIRSQGVRAWIYWLQIGVALLTILLSASRAGFLASCLAASIVPLTFSSLRRRQRTAILAIAVLALVAVLALIPAASWTRLSTIGTEVSKGTLNQRELIWSAGLQVFRQSPFEGVGVGAYPRSVEPILGWPKGWVIVAHNTFLSVLVETGVAGFALFAIFLALLVVKIRRMAGLNRILWTVMMAVWVLGVSTLSWEIRKPTWLLFALVLTHASAGESFAATATAALRWRTPARATREVVLP